MGKVFAGTDLKYGYTWSVTASHELLEMLADPNINLTVLVQSSDTAGKLYAYEVCDTCEADENGYEIDGVLLSDFVFPSWFEDFRTEPTQFDQTNKIKPPGRRSTHKNEPSSKAARSGTSSTGSTTTRK